MSDHPILPGYWRERSQPQHVGIVTTIKQGQVCWRATTRHGNLHSARLDTLEFLRRFEKCPANSAQSK